MAKRLIQAAYAEGPLRVVRTVRPKDAQGFVSGPPVRWVQGGWRCTNTAGRAECWNVQRPALNAVEATDGSAHGAAVTALVF